MKGWESKAKMPDLMFNIQRFQGAQRWLETAPANKDTLGVYSTSESTITISQLMQHVFHLFY